MKHAKGKSKILTKINSSNFIVHLKRQTQQELGSEFSLANCERNF